MRIPVAILSFAISLLLVLLGADAHAQTYKWARGGGTNQSLASSINKEAVYFMCTDPNGNVYALSTVGINAVTADTFYWPGGIGSSQSILFTSHNCNGQMRFAKLITGTGNYPNGIVADNMGHVYIAFDGTHTSANPLRIRYDTTISGLTYNRDVIIQYDTTGHMNWLRFVGQDAYATWTGTGGWNNYLALDGAQRPHFVVYAKYGVPLEPSFITNQRGFYDLSYDISGNLLAVKRLNIDSTLVANGITIDKQSDKMYAFGRRNFDAFPDSSRYEFIAALDVNRNRIWIDTLTNPVSVNGKTFNGVVADGQGNLYASIYASGKVVFRGDTAFNTLSTTPYGISVIAKMDTAGNPQWMRTFSGTSSVNGLADLTLFGTNKLAACGVMTAMVACSTDTISIYPGEGQNAYFTILDTAGYVHELKQLHGVGFYDVANKVVSGRAGNLYIGGKVENNIWGGSLTPYTSVGGDSDYFIMKYGVDCGCTAMPVANYTYSGTGLTRSLTYTGTTAGIDSVRWSFGDGGTSTAIAPTHTYTAAGTYTTCVRVYSACGNDMRCYEVTVACTALPAAAHIDTGNAVRGFTYTGTTTPYYDSVRWSFGDGSADTGLHTLHTYAAAGTYTVCAIVYTRCGTDTACRAITVTTVTVTTLQPQPDVIQAYPNPSAGNIIITGITQPTTYQLHNAVRHTVAMGTMAAGPNQLNITQLPPGIYLLEMQTPTGQRVVLRVMKQ